MTGFVALDVFIGLAFIFLLYSLLATIVVELIASAIGLRAKVLHWTIARMLTDTRSETPLWLWFLLALVSLFFGWVLVYLHALFIKSGKALLTRFYEQPQIKFLSEGGVRHKPSYMRPETFSLGLVEALKDIGKDASDGSEKAMINEALKDDTDSEKKDDTDSEIKEKIGKETRKQISTYWEQSSGDIIKFRSLLEDWFEHMNDRATGWYKQKVQGLLLLLGLILAIGFRIDAIEIGKRLAVDKDLREQSVQLAIAYMEQHGNNADSLYTAMKDSLSDDLQKANSVYGLGWDEASFRCIFCTVWNSYWSLGYLITAFAISLGAPFWFDMLNKLVKLRSSMPQASNTQQGKESQSSTSSSRGTGNDVIPARKRLG